MESGTPGWVLEASPGLHMNYGDPSALPLEYKRDMLRAMITRFEGRDRMWLDTDPETLSRLADPGLAEEVRRLSETEIKRKICASPCCNWSATDESSTVSTRPWRCFRR